MDPDTYDTFQKRFWTRALELELDCEELIALSAAIAGVFRDCKVQWSCNHYNTAEGRMAVYPNIVSASTPDLLQFGGPIHLACEAAGVSVLHLLPTKSDMLQHPSHEISLVSSILVMFWGECFFEQREDPKKPVSVVMGLNWDRASTSGSLCTLPDCQLAMAAYGFARLLRSSGHYKRDDKYTLLRTGSIIMWAGPRRTVQLRVHLATIEDPTTVPKNLRLIKQLAKDIKTTTAPGSMLYVEDVDFNLVAGLDECVLNCRPTKSREFIRPTKLADEAKLWKLENGALLRDPSAAPKVTKKPKREKKAPQGTKKQKLSHNAASSTNAPGSHNSENSDLPPPSPPKALSAKETNARPDNDGAANDQTGVPGEKAKLKRIPVNNSGTENNRPPQKKVKLYHPASDE